ncbi:MAG: hypothetical protein NW237_02830 [Cyanobacteriota bacterium]|nr:hypothetical protein [Cyanobacteriota bacterium]
MSTQKRIGHSWLRLAICSAVWLFSSATVGSQQTRFGGTAELEGDITCGKGTGGHHTFMATDSFRIYICGDEKDPAFPRFYVSFNDEGNLGLRLTAAQDPRQGRYLIFENGGYQYILDGGNAQTQTALLIVKEPDGTTVLEEVASVYLTRDNNTDSTAGIPGCSPNESLFVDAETANFRLYICGGDLPHTYVGVSKKDGSAIRLELINYEPTGDRFLATNGDVGYLLTTSELLVTQAGQTLLQEPILRWN